jgi:tRNA-specific 2-thiouridylase
MAKARYRSAEVPCTVVSDGNELVVTFDEPQRAITPGQALVLYGGGDDGDDGDDGDGRDSDNKGEYVLGGGTIHR